jgi:hypothetical protein
MRRNLIRCCALAFAFAFPPAASAAVHGASTGTVTADSGWSFTIQTPGRKIGVVNALIRAADSVTQRDYPYVYGGGHTQAGVASIGIKGTGYNGRRIGFDCSGAVGAVLAGAGLWAAGTGVPADNGIISELLGERLIASGVGTGPVEVTLWDHWGVHIFMNIDGRFFGTSDGSGGGDSRGGAGWLDDGAPDTSNRSFKPYHFLPGVLRSSTTTGHAITFELGSQSVAEGLEPGENVKVRYKETRSGSLVATAIAYPGSITTTGTVSSLARSGTSFAITTTRGSALTFSTASAWQLLEGVVPGDTVRVTYSKVGSKRIAHALTVTATPQGGTPTSGAPPS